VVLLLGSAVANHGLVHRLHTSEGAARRRVLWGTLGFNLGLLSVFKYSDFLLRTVERGGALVGIPVQLPLFGVALPVGVSFFTFEAISYAVDVYRRTARPVPFVDFGLYLSWFPHLVAGPLVRITELVPQLRAPPPDAIPLSKAGRLILGGLALKVLVADTLATQLVDPVFARPELYAGPTVVLAIYGYTAQILCDFSAYTDIAQGVSLLLGIELPDNFRQPYRAHSLRDFWRRWHMTLSRWLRDYLYIPLGGSREGRGRTVAALLTTMLLGGLWHGADWRFVVWGGLHGGLLVLERGLGLHRRPRSLLARWVRTGLTVQLVALAWVPFRAPSLEQAMQVWARIPESGGAWIPLTLPIGMALGVTLLSQMVPEDAAERLDRWLERGPPWVLALLSAVVLVAIDALGPDGVAAFLYYQF